MSQKKKGMSRCPDSWDADNEWIKRNFLDPDRMYHKNDLKNRRSAPCWDCFTQPSALIKRTTVKNKIIYYAPSDVKCNNLKKNGGDVVNWVDSSHGKGYKPRPVMKIQDHRGTTEYGQQVLGDDWSLV